MVSIRPKTLVSNIDRYSSGVASSTAPTRSKPALLTGTSSPPNASCAAFTAVAAPPSCDTSSGAALPAPGKRLINSTRYSVRRAVATRLSPRASTASASLVPKPVEEAVMSHVLAVMCFLYSQAPG